MQALIMLPNPDCVWQCFGRTPKDTQFHQNLTAQLSRLGRINLEIY